MDPKDGILTAAHSVFARHGFRQTGMAMVAQEAGLSRQSLYHHFASKEALFAALVVALHESAAAAARDAAGRGGKTVADAIAGVMLAYHESLASGLSGSPFAAELIEESGRQCGPTVSAYARRFEAEFEALIKSFVREGRLFLRTNLSARDVADMISIAAKGIKSAQGGVGDARYAGALRRIIEVICAGVEARQSQAGRAKRVQASRTNRGRVVR